MIVDAHAHACGELHNLGGIENYIDNNKLDKLVLCPGEPKSIKNRSVPMICNIVKSENLGYRFNHIISLVTQLSGVSKSIDKQNEIISLLAKSNLNKIVQAYWVNPLEKNCIEKLEKNHKKYNFKIIKVHQCWHKFDVLSETVQKIVEWSIKKRFLYLYI